MSPLLERAPRGTAARPPLVMLAAVILAASSPLAVRADLVKLKSGGEVRGQIDRAGFSASSPSVTIETLTGATVVIERDHLAFVTRRPLLVEEYETLARQTPTTVPDQWALAEWCRKNNLKTQRERHLECVVELDPGHEEAHHALGHSLHKGTWVTRDELMTSQGYVRYKGKYITPQELELIEKSKAQLDAEREWFARIRLWHGWINGRHEDRRAKGFEELQNIDDPAAIPALSRAFADDANQAIRTMYLSILEQMPGTQAVPALVRQSLFDVDYEVRYRALNALRPEHHAAAMPLYLKELRNSDNNVIRRAGQALGRVGDDSCVAPLIDALVTRHTYTVLVPEKKGIAVGTDGSFSLGGGVTAGQVTLPPELVALAGTGRAIVQNTGPPERVRKMTVKYDHQNTEVLDALRKLTGESFGYEERTWKLWWTQKKANSE